MSAPPGGPYNVYLDAAGATQTTDLTDEDGNAITAVEQDQDFFGPDATTVVWLRPASDASLAQLGQPASSGGSLPVPAPGDAGKYVTVSVTADGFTLEGPPSGGSGPTLLYYVSGPLGTNDRGYGTVSTDDLAAWGDHRTTFEGTTSTTAANERMTLDIYDLSNTLTSVAEVRLLVRKVRDGSGAIVDGTPFHANATGGAVPLNNTITFDTWPDADTADLGRGSLHAFDDTAIAVLTPGTYLIDVTIVGPAA